MLCVSVQGKVDNSLCVCAGWSRNKW